MPGLHEYLYGIRPSDVLVLGTNQELDSYLLSPKIPSLSHVIYRERWMKNLEIERGRERWRELCVKYALINELPHPPNKPRRV